MIFNLFGKSKVLIIYSSYYENITNSLLTSAVDELRGVSVKKLKVPGVLEIPSALSMSLSKNYDGYVVLGCVIRGETSHYDIVAIESARAILQLSIDHKLAIGNGILTVESEDQALSRVSKGGDAAKAALRMIELRKQLDV